MGRKFALIVANAEYEDAGLARLSAPGLDAHDFAGALQAPHIGAFDEVTTLLNEVEANIRRAVARLFAGKLPDDLLLLYFSGHGVRDDQGQLYLAARDTERSLLSATGIPAEFVSSQMSASRSRRQVLILDCCNSGAFARGTKAAVGGSMGTAAAFEGTGYGRVVLTATDATQYAWEGDQFLGEASNSVFTHFLVQGLETGAADANADGTITLDELYDYAYAQVVAVLPQQTPGKWSYREQGELVIARNPKLPASTATQTAAPAAPPRPAARAPSPPARVARAVGGGAPVWAGPETQPSVASAAGVLWQSLGRTQAGQWLARLLAWPKLAALVFTALGVLGWLLAGYLRQLVFDQAYHPPSTDASAFDSTFDFAAFDLAYRRAILAGRLAWQAIGALVTMVLLAVSRPNWRGGRVLALAGGWLLLLAAGWGLGLLTIPGVSWYGSQWVVPALVGAACGLLLTWAVAGRPAGAAARGRMALVAAGWALGFALGHSVYTGLLIGAATFWLLGEQAPAA
jgi:uncharacterized caspase-like protein